ncbi:MAG: hypothetical protein KGO93_05175 [Cyanobacteria bacterium REEB446]|nr:hypothetical protein [Cyanobacteria bacterium REEB446]
MTSSVNSQAAVLEKPAVKTAGSDSSQPPKHSGDDNENIHVDNESKTKTTATKKATKKEELDSLHGKEPESFALDESDSKIKDTVNSDNSEGTENGVSHKSASSVLEKMMEVVTWGAVGLNLSSIAAKLSAIAGPFKAFSGLLEKIALVSTKAQAIAFSSKLLQQAFEEKDPMLALAGFGKVFQIVFAKFGNFLQLGGFQTAFDQLNPGLKPTTGLDKFSSFGHGVKEYLKAFKVVFKDILDDPIGYLKLSPKNGHVERVLVPGAISILAGTFGGMLAGENKVAKVISGILRHVTGGIIGGDIILGKLENNKEMNLSGNAYIAASAIDCGANLIQDKEKEDIVHQLGTTVNLIAELFFSKGLERHAPA